MSSKTYRVIVSDPDGTVIDMFDVTLDQECQDDGVTVLDTSRARDQYDCSLEGDIVRAINRYQQG